MDAVAVELHREVGPVVHDEGDVALLADRPQRVGGADDGVVGDVLQAQLEGRDVAAVERGAQFVGKDRRMLHALRRDEIEPAMRRRASLFRCHSSFLFRARLCGTTANGSQPRTQCCPSRCALNHICELKNRPRLRPRCRPHVAPCERGLTCSSFAAATARSPRPTWMNNFPDRSGCRSTAVRCSSSLLRRPGVPRCDVEERDVGTRARRKRPATSPRRARQSSGDCARVTSCPDRCR